MTYIIPFEAILPIFIAFAICALLGPVVIPFLRRLKVGQTERKELESHQKKNGTPTMGGVMIIAAILLTSAFFAGRYPRIIPIALLTLGFGLIGFLDDFLKVVLHRSDGLLAWQKMLCQIAVTTAFAAYMAFSDDASLAMRIPFSGGRFVDIGWLSIPLLYFAVIGTVNGVNFTDGLDGLAANVTVMVAGFFFAVSLATGAGISPVAGAAIGALLAFLLYNVYPASIFMGDTGSLALGGFVAASAYMTQTPLYLPIIGLIYLAEVLSVIIQVTYFRKTGGKRFFRMAPIHHHFELGGWSETRVVAVFSITTLLLCLVAFLGI